MVNITGNALWQLIRLSDTMSKMVLLTLLFLSIICWSIFIYKLLLIKTKQRHIKQVLEKLKSVTTLDQLLAITANVSGTLPGYFLSKNLSFLKGILEVNKERGSVTLSEHQWELVQQTMDQTIDDLLTHEESYQSFLSTTFTISPLLGLFGTVWGLVHAFIDISKKQSADIAVVAPGIAEALITTLAGLMVAIPVLAMFNYITTQIRTLEGQLLQLADKVSTIVQKIFVR